MSRRIREPLPLWRKIFGMAVAIILVGPFFYVLFWPNSNGNTVNGRLLDALLFLASPYVQFLIVVIILLAVTDIIRRYLPRMKGNQPNGIGFSKSGTNPSWYFLSSYAELVECFRLGHLAAHRVHCASAVLSYTGKGGKRSRFER